MMLVLKAKKWAKSLNHRPPSTVTTTFFVPDRIYCMMPDPSRHEATLVEHSVAGDADAFGELYLLHLDAIYRYIYYRVGDVKDAEDLTEEVFLNAWEALPGYKRRGSPFTSWLYRIAHNVVVDYRRRQKPTVPMPSPEEADWESKQPTSLEQVIEAEEIAALATATAQLPEEQQQVIVLRFIEGLKHAEVARIIGKSEGACRIIQHRALVALNRLLSGAPEKVNYV
jgi:RNA polymerase sigma-70 factor (ECF subfamily)